jgi:alanine racemase
MPPLDGVLLLAAATAAPSSCVLASDDPASAVPPRTFPDTALVRPARAEVDLAAVRHNVEVLREISSPAALMAVVKADGYGHGGVPVASVALEAGADRLGVALPSEGSALREAGISAPVLVLSEPRPAEMDLVVDADLTPAVYTDQGIAAAGASAARAGRSLPVHLKVDTGMHRVGAPPERAAEMARTIVDHGHLTLEGLWTHFARADEPEVDVTARQLARFEGVVRAVTDDTGRPPIVHAANSAATLAHRDTHLDLVRCGIALYGIAPSSSVAHLANLRPALRLVSEVTLLRGVGPDEGISYGHRYRTREATTIATVPIGYADGVPRRFHEVGGEVLIGGARRPVVGVVTMDQLLVDLGPDQDVSVGDEVVLIGEQGDDRVSANDWGDLLGTIGYEVVCGLGARVPRVYRSG